ncbi:Serine/threonine-protein phosphatase 4 regulatory subunit 4 [Strongyloides ratti]|uniref:Serine/threonine-protein phosphatase 4 regulatory subunit 4 n=1 Tax=Strongyloides ratti TaxID=34506 RepID=A0A090LMS0_STRRB|nr:Serine/threonine-protein phosphatase 4 regulatory subunit 4 [Strongyloides ratti]CEF71046.1 Serine/threonine-protein phosphatase 4 regulatory subunit 4 [Strongyloides ratti]
MCDDLLNTGNEDVSTSYYNNPQLVCIERTIQKLENSINWDDYDSPNEDLTSEIEKASKAFRSDNSVQKTLFISKLKHLSAEDPELFVSILLPALQDLLDKDFNRDIHESIALSLSSIVQDEFAISPDILISPICKFLLDNSIPSRDNAQVRLMIEEFLKCMPKTNEIFIDNYVLPFILKYSKPNEKIFRRMICARIFNQIKIEHCCSSNLPSEKIQSVILQLCQDSNQNVRQEMAANIQQVAECYSHDGFKENDWEIILKLFKDEIVDIKCAALRQFYIIKPLLKKNQLMSCYEPLIKRAVNESLLTKDDTLMVVADQIGVWFGMFESVMNEKEAKWFYNAFQNLFSMAMKKASGKVIEDGEELPKDQKMLQLVIKNYPYFFTYCYEMDGGVSIENNLDKVIGLADSSTAKIIGSFIFLLYNNKSNTNLIYKICMQLLQKRYKSSVVADLFNPPYNMWRKLYEESIADDEEKIKKFWDAISYTMEEFGKSFQHRNPVNLLRHIDEIISPHIKEQYISIILKSLKNMIINGNGLPVKQKAGETLIKTLGVTRSIEERDNVVSFLKINLISHKNFYRRRLAMYILPCILHYFSIQFIDKYFLKDYLELAKDDVEIIKHLLAQSFLSMKRYLSLPSHELVLQAIEGAQRKMLESEIKDELKEDFMNLALKLSRAESCESDVKEKEKLEREKLLWKEENNYESNKMNVDSVIIVSNDNEKIKKTWNTKEITKSNKQRGRCIITVTDHKIAKEKASASEFKQSRLPIPICRSSSYGAVILKSKESLSLQDKKMKYDFKDIKTPKELIYSHNVKHLTVENIKPRSFSSEPKNNDKKYKTAKIVVKNANTGIKKENSTNHINQDSGYDEDTSIASNSFDDAITLTFGLHKVSSCSEIAKKPSQCMLKIKQTSS